MNNNKHYFAEIVQSSLQEWVAQTWQWDNFPKFGSIVTIENKQRIVFGIVHQVQTGSLDPIHTPVAYKKTEAELKAEQPQIFEFLKTTFSCLTIGYQENSKIFYQLAPEPPKIHAFVGHIDKELTKKFFLSEQYLHLLFGYANRIGNIDELLLAILKFKASIINLNSEKISNFVKTFSLLTGNDYRRLKLFLQRVEQTIG